MDEQDSESWKKQRATEETILKVLFKHGEKEPVLTRDTHITMLNHSLSSLPPGYRSLDASRPWVVYWITGALSLLAKKGEKTISKELEERVIDFFRRCQSPEGGFGGGPGQLSHFAPTYAAVNAIASIGTKEAYKVVNRKTMLQFLLKMKQEDGSFRMHHCGEADVRSTYCALSVASILNLLVPEVTHKASQYIASCQTYEGGFGGEPFNEAHGGYTFCGLAGSIILGTKEEIDIPSLLRFVTDRQMRVEGGFQGRANKLVDSCYSFWQGSNLPMLNSLPSLHHLSTIPPEQQTKPQQTEPHHLQQSVLGWYHDNSTLFNRDDLQKYILICCQDRLHGGFRDKPPMGKDLYHTFYSLCGLSIAQNSTGGEENDGILGGEENRLGVVHPVYGVEIERLEKAKDFFQHEKEE